MNERLWWNFGCIGLIQPDAHLVMHHNGLSIGCLHQCAITRQAVHREPSDLRFVGWGRGARRIDWYGGHDRTQIPEYDGISLTCAGQELVIGAKRKPKVPPCGLVRSWFF